MAGQRLIRASLTAVLSGLESPTHILFVLVVAVLVLGPKRLPAVGRSLGAGLREFRETIGGVGRDRDDS